MKQLASIILQMNGGRGPDILGSCEVEKEHVLQLLVQGLASLGGNYKVAHHDASDGRGIDVGFIYDAGLFSAKDLFWHVVMRRTGTRDLLQVNFRTREDRLFVLVANLIQPGLARATGRQMGTNLDSQYRDLEGIQPGYMAVPSARIH